MLYYKILNLIKKIMKKKLQQSLKITTLINLHLMKMNSVANSFLESPPHV